jgi:hypothetical protein
MVIAPPLTDLHYPPIRWQTVFTSTTPLVGKSVQNDGCCGISATVSLQPNEFRQVRPRLFRNTERWIAGRGKISPNSVERTPPRGFPCVQFSPLSEFYGQFNVR